MRERKPGRTGSGHGVRSTHLLISGLFFVSGFSGLVYEIVSVRLLRLVMGNTTFAISAVLTAFMGGLALGSYVGGRIADRRHDLLRVFAVLEGSIALYFFFAPWLFDSAQPVYRWVYQNTETSFVLLSLLRFVLCGLLLLVPTTLMGATLPVLSRLVVRRSSDLGASVGTLYAVNTFGAVLGVAGSGFVLIPNVGVSRTLHLACAASAAVSAAAFLLYRRLGDTGQLAAAPAAARPGATRPGATRPAAGGGKSAAPAAAGRWSYGRRDLHALLVAYAAAGLAALVYEVAWSRVLTLLIGSSVYAFSLMLTAFIFGLAFGAALIARFVDRLGDPMKTLAGVEIAVGVSALVVVPLIDRLPLWVTRLIFYTKDSFVHLQLMEFALALAIMLVPTTLMGAAFPLVNRLFYEAAHGVGRTVGTVYSANTIGAIFGSFAAGFLLIPLVGIQGTIYAAVLINVAAGCVLVGLSKSLSPRARAAAVGLAAAGALAAMAVTPAWDPNRMSFGPFLQAVRASDDVILSAGKLQQRLQAKQVVLHSEGVSTTITVKRRGQLLTLYVNGKPDASSATDLPTQFMLAHAPMLLHPNPRRVLVIGLASGITLGAAGQHPAETLDCAEIAPGMIRAARLFDPYNHQILDDPRVTIFIADGRNHLALSNRPYDVIVSEPSNPWLAGVADLFTVEFFQICRKRLDEGGIACVWLESYAIDEPSFRTVLATFHQVFPDMMIWSSRASDFLLVGCKGNLAVDYRRLVERLADPKIAGDLRRIQVRTVVDLLGNIVADAAGVAAYSAGAPIHTDDNALLEFSSPRSLFARPEKSLATEIGLRQHRLHDASFLVADDDNAAAVERVRSDLIRRGDARYHLRQGQLLMRLGQEDRAVVALATAARLDRDDPWFQARFQSWMGAARSHAAEGDRPGAIRVYQRLVEIDPGAAAAHHRLGLLLLEEGRPALRHLLQAAKLKPDELRYHLAAASCALGGGQWSVAVRYYHQALAIKPNEVLALNNLAWLLANQPAAAAKVMPEPDPLAHAIRLAEQACQVTARRNTKCLSLLARLYARAGRTADAQQTARETLALAETTGNRPLADELRKLIQATQQDQTRPEN